jgi:hypothetical protein
VATVCPGATSTSIADLFLHLHRLDRQEGRTLGDLVAGSDRDRDDEPR